MPFALAPQLSGAGLASAALPNLAVWGWRHTADDGAPLNPVLERGGPLGPSCFDTGDTIDIVLELTYATDSNGSPVDFVPIVSATAAAPWQLLCAL